MTPEGKELLLKVKRHLLSKPTRLCMSSWVLNEAVMSEHGRVRVRGKNKFFVAFHNLCDEPIEQKIPSCGTVGCIAGWCSILFGDDPGSREIIWFKRAQYLLGLDHDSAYRLFLCEGWPKKDRANYARAKTASARAKLVAHQIDLFIAEHS